MPRSTIPNRRSVLLDVAEEQVVQHGFDAVRVADIARLAGVGKGAVYLEFSSKEAIWQALLIRSMRRMVDHSRRILDATPDDELSFALLHRSGVEALLSDRIAMAALLGEKNVLGRQVEALGPRRYALRVEWVRELLRVFAENGAVAADIDLDGLAVALSSATLGLLSASSAFGPLTEEQLEGAVGALTQLVERGVSRTGRNPVALRQAVVEFLERLQHQLDDSPRWISPNCVDGFRG